MLVPHQFGVYLLLLSIYPRAALAVPTSQTPLSSQYLLNSPEGPPLQSANPQGPPEGAPEGAPAEGPSGAPPSEGPSKVLSEGPSGGPSLTLSGAPKGAPSDEPTGDPSGGPPEDPSGGPPEDPSGGPPGAPCEAPIGDPPGGPPGAPCKAPIVGPSEGVDDADSISMSVYPSVSATNSKGLLVSHLISSSFRISTVRALKRNIAGGMSFKRQNYSGVHEGRSLTISTPEASLLSLSSTPSSSSSSSSSSSDTEISRAGVDSRWFAVRGWGWRHPDNWEERHYVCMYSMDGRPCGPGGVRTELYPSGLHCIEGQCCSKIHNTIYFGGNLCTPNKALCVFIHEAYSYGKCRCTSNSCSAAADCIEELGEHGGVYCKCKEGTRGDGRECFEDFCMQRDCTPGRCVQHKDIAKCICPKGFEEQDNKCVRIAPCKRGLTDICGPIERVEECVDISETEYTCVCRTGYTAVRQGKSVSCEIASNNLSCSDNPCGIEGVASCKDLTEGGVECTCNLGYILERDTTNKALKCMLTDPCKTGPCGTETVAKSCSRKPNGGYACICQDTAELVEAEASASDNTTAGAAATAATAAATGPYCRQKTQQFNILPYLALAAGILSVFAIAVGIWWFGFKQNKFNYEGAEFDYTQSAYLSPNS